MKVGSFSSKRCRVIGLTGGIAAGKSTVAGVLKSAGAQVLDADCLARDVLKPGQPAYGDVVQDFGRRILRSDGAIDRGALGTIVFSDSGLRKRLEAIMHPAIERAFVERVKTFIERGIDLLVYEAALLVETGRYRDLDGLIVVIAAEETRILRLARRDRLSKDQSRARLAAQGRQEEKIACADYLIDNSNGLDSTRAQVLDVWDRLRNRARS